MKYLIIGGSKSGKSEIGEKISLVLSKEKVIYIATMKPYDKEDKERIKKHIQRRQGLNYETFEIERDLHKIVNSISEEDTVLIDSITSLLTNEMFCNEKIIKNPSLNILYGLEKILFKAKNTLVVSDYIFNDAIEYDEITKNYQRELARVNRRLAEICDNVIECSFGNVKYYKDRGENII
ncbi:bifunctional adenosylcobinamide kinase/adenosylcobinamide-phosphate guanylyltransferase [Clostridium sp. C2-6-12]|uniref:bifunctional adenosylcobinamide kinase/adenosylcobinamide-phosphate guanylyltransferase n=1 Tax=Clostridium sp. C2-6-12 TaxID=2698832 RepID=UPI001370417F|nr:bifunctional adenosylcobinamide kinase/adenosylcobinamide-phosphate guanylyltransferase [Clostridium sp. C2-6-12]